LSVIDRIPFYLAGTIHENISVGHPETGGVISSARQAGAHKFITELPMGYETQIGEGGGMLSGGQRQRLLLITALY